MTMEKSKYLPPVEKYRHGLRTPTHPVYLATPTRKVWGIQFPSEYVRSSKRRIEQRYQEKGVIEQYQAMASNKHDIPKVALLKTAGNMMVVVLDGHHRFRLAPKYNQFVLCRVICYGSDNDPDQIVRTAVDNLSNTAILAHSRFQERSNKNLTPSKIKICHYSIEEVVKAIALGGTPSTHAIINLLLKEGISIIRTQHLEQQSASVGALASG